MSVVLVLVLVLVFVAVVVAVISAGGVLVLILIGASAVVPANAVFVVSGIVVVFFVAVAVVGLAPEGDAVASDGERHTARDVPGQAHHGLVAGQRAVAEPEVEQEIRVPVVVDVLLVAIGMPVLAVDLMRAGKLDRVRVVRSRSMSFRIPGRSGQRTGSERRNTKYVTVPAEIED